MSLSVAAEVLCDKDGSEISPDQVKLLYSQAGKPLEYVDKKFSYDRFCNTALKQKLIFWLRAQF